MKNKLLESFLDFIWPLILPFIIFAVIGGGVYLYSKYILDDVVDEAIENMPKLIAEKPARSVVVSTFVYDEHNYIEFVTPNGTSEVIHSPGCCKCNPPKNALITEFNPSFTNIYNHAEGSNVFIKSISLSEGSNIIESISRCIVLEKYINEYQGY